MGAEGAHHARLLAESVALREAISNAALDAIVSMDHAGQIVEFNRAAERMFGYPRDEALGARVAELLIPLRHRTAHREGIQSYLATGEAKLLGRPIELDAMRADGTEFPAEIAVVSVDGAEPPLFVASIRDLTRVTESEERFRLLVDGARDFAIIMLDASGGVQSWNAGASRLTGYEEATVIGAHFSIFYPPDERAAGRPEELLRLAAENERHEHEGWHVRRDGTRFWANVTIRVIRYEDGSIRGFVKISRDFSERLKAREALQAREATLAANLKEREVLLQEVHHRVKNNLQVIASLVNMQLRRLKDPAGRTALQECQARVVAIALIHEQLYQSPDYARVPFAQYARRLAHDIFHAAGASTPKVALRVDVEPVALSVDKAIPCGLIINELISNALKHAFPDDRQGCVLVELRGLPDGRIRLAVSDDGLGLPADLDPTKTTSLGMHLVTMLAEQLDGELDVDRSAGTTFQVTFLAGEPS